MHIRSILKQRVEEAKRLSRSDTRVPEVVHIDELSPEYRRPSTWAQGGLHCLRLAIDLRENMGVLDPVVLIYTLRPQRTRRGPFLKSLNDVQHWFDVTPPEIAWLLPHRGLFNTEEFDANRVTLEDCPDWVKESFWVEVVRIEEGERIVLPAVWLFA